MVVVWGFGVFFFFPDRFCVVLLWIGLVFQEGKQALAGVAQWIEHRALNQRATGLIPSQGLCLGCGPGPRGRGVCV